MLHDKKMDDTLWNHKYVIYMKKLAFAQPKTHRSKGRTKKSASLLVKLTSKGTFFGIWAVVIFSLSQYIGSRQKTGSNSKELCFGVT